MKSVTLYTTERCSLCVSAKALLQRRGIAFMEVNLARDPDGRDALMRRTGMVTFPQIVVGEEVLGGFRELVAADKAGWLADLLAADEPASEGPDGRLGTAPSAI
ncbi:MAG TPA: glutaredoxin domain-containing protein [Solirubrobacteraceae bacterium]|jgi:glutaredoxin 3